MDYAGEISVEEVWEKLKQESHSFLVDVRTRAEWAFVGSPALENNMQPVIGQEWQVFPTMAVDEDFAEKLSNTIAQHGGDTESALLFLCRSGVRSLAAARAMTAAGYTNSFNITHGFEGDLDDGGHRGHLNGWKAGDLPWRQQ